MHLVCLDLEGVLLPEMWIAIAEATGLPELRRTTRDEPDYDKLMHYRLAILDREGLTLPRLQEVIATLQPLPGAVEFMDWLRPRTRVVILSDTFVEFATPLMGYLGHPALFCHNLTVDAATGRITGYRLRLPDQKRKAVEAFRKLNFTVLAAGDSYNDLSMLAAAHHGLLFRPPLKLRSDFPQYPVADDHAALQQALAPLLA